MRKKCGSTLFSPASSAAILPLLLLLAISACRGSNDSSRMSALESAAVAELRNLNAAQSSFNTTHNHYACTTAELGSQFGLIDHELTYGAKRGYTFGIQCTTRNGSTTYDIWATPNNGGIGSGGIFCTDESGVVRSASRQLSVCADAFPVQ